MPLIRVNGRFFLGYQNPRTNQLTPERNLTMGDRAMISFANKQKVLTASSWPEENQCVRRK